MKPIEVELLTKYFNPLHNNTKRHLKFAELNNYERTLLEQIDLHLALVKVMIDSLEKYVQSK
jgi:hypothetical protein